MVAGATIGYLAGNLWLFHLGAHSYDIMAEKTFAYVAATYGPADLYDVPATVTPAKVWAGTPYAEVGFPYGPVMGIVFTAIGAVYRAAFGQGGIPPMDSIQLEVLIKLFNVVLGLVDGVLIYLILRKRLGNVLSAIGAGLFVFNPAVWFMMSVWGETQTISLVLDDTTASIAMFALAAHASEREAHIREVERSGQNLPEGSYGRCNRQAITARETRVAARLRAVEQAYRTATEHGTASRPPEPTRTFRSPERQADGEMELE